MSSTIAVVHYCEGAGHATRMVAIARALEAAGAEVHLAGGGAGSRFADLNGYDAYEPTTVDYIGDYQDGTMRDVLSGSVPDSARRTTDLAEWLREIDPDALVTDDMFAVMAAVRVGVPQYVVKHDMPDIYEDRPERLGAQFHCALQLTAARRFFYPTVWEPSPKDPADATNVPPIALDGTGDDVPDDLDAVVVPSHYSNLDEAATRLADRGLTVIDVGSDDWDPVPTLLPYLRAADVVVCSGYSTVMDAAVAGTSCVVLPSTDEQAGVARRLHDRRGFMVVGDVDAAVAAAQSPTESPTFRNGASVIADDVLDDLRSVGRPVADVDQRVTRRGLLRVGAATVGTSVIGTTVNVSARGPPDEYCFLKRGYVSGRCDYEFTTAAMERNRDRFDFRWPRELRSLTASRFAGAEVLETRFSDSYDSVAGPGCIHAMAIIEALDGEDADFRHWIWLGVDTAETEIRRGLLPWKSSPFEPKHARISFAPNRGALEDLAVVRAADASAFEAFGPNETPSDHQMGDRPDGAVSFDCRRDDRRVLSCLGRCDISTPGDGTVDWSGSTLQYAFDSTFRRAAAEDRPE